MRKAKVIKGKELKFETGREPPLMNKKGICSNTVENPGLKINRTLVPPGAINQRHYHINCDAGMHILKGRLMMFLGPDHEMEEVIAEEGDFVFIPAGVIHGLANLSNTEPAELLAAKNNVSDDTEEGTVFVEALRK
jgi:uncharacterized RmlC-like cupin family protein